MRPQQEPETPTHRYSAFAFFSFLFFFKHLSCLLFKQAANPGTHVLRSSGPQVLTSGPAAGGQGPGAGGAAPAAGRAAGRGVPGRRSGVPGPSLRNRSSCFFFFPSSRLFLFCVCYLLLFRFLLVSTFNSYEHGNV